MNKPSHFIDLSLIKTHSAFRAVFIARFISIVALGMLAVAVPVQIQQLTNSPLLVGLAVTLAGAGMFIGLLTGGVLADRYERRRLILFARSTCGLGFVALCINALLPAPSVVAVFVLGLWDGFFGAIGVTALLAATPALVGRENLMKAGAITMLTVRFGSILSPAVAGLVIAHGSVAWNYGLTAFGTLLTVLTLLKLPALPPPPQPREHPLKALATGVQFLFASPLVGMAAFIGALVTLASAVRVLYPALAPHWQIDINQLGLMYAAVPLGAAIGALTSGRLAHSPRPGVLILASAFAAFVALGLFSLMPLFELGLLCLVAFGYFSAINSLVQYTMIQALTPDALLGRINSLWTAQNVTGDAIGAAIIGSMGSLLLPQQAASLFGFAAALLGLLMWRVMRRLRQYQPPAPTLAEQL
ncbi:MAG: enterobactin transporter EntS [Enterobacterales bacterium endosymbiont of Blomia tropicalis]|uniref:enterobactin transporter EntS n=1 Tax=Mixta mediterraneensis TaxID=2758443 RepID=UPI0025A71AAA|nr:enterobactin transporter EntS [Mixta mediterraneensis]MDL4912730.1 enterobactin transporter EntS [Mixta mediterraneensis]